jgi:hypothetical protein
LTMCRQHYSTSYRQPNVFYHVSYYLPAIRPPQPQEGAQPWKMNPNTNVR